MTKKKATRKRDNSAPQKQQEGDKKGTSVQKGNTLAIGPQLKTKGNFYYQFDNDKPQLLMGQEPEKPFNINLLPSSQSAFCVQFKDKKFEIFFDEDIGAYFYCLHDQFLTVLSSSYFSNLLIQFDRHPDMQIEFKSVNGDKFKIFFQPDA